MQHRVPRMWPPVCRWLRLERRHVYKDPGGALHEIVATTGVDQGCPSASFLACLGVAPVHEALSELSTVAGLQDDTYLLTPPAGLKAALEAAAPAFNATLALCAERTVMSSKRCAGLRGQLTTTSMRASTHAPCSSR